MSFFKNLFNTGAKQQPVASGVNFQSSTYGRVIPLVYGTTRVAGNLISYGNFQSFTSSQSSGKGGGGGGKGGGGTTTYSASFAFAMCEGPIQGVGIVWHDKNVSTVASSGLSLFVGSYPQTALGTIFKWSFFDAFGNQKSGATTGLNYNGIAYVSATNYGLGQSPSLPNFNYEVEGILSNSVSGQQDADPSQVVVDLLTNAHYGAGFPAGLIGDLSAFKNYCIATGMLVSPQYTSQSPVSQMIDELCTMLNSVAVWSNGTLRIVPYGDQAITQGQQTLATETFTIQHDVNGNYTYKVAQAGTFVADQGVSYSGGAALTKATSRFFLSAGHYYVDSTGTYYFSSADAAQQVQIKYLWAATASYQPPTPIYDLADDDFIAVPQGSTGSSSTTNSDPILLVRKRQSDKINSVQLEYLDRSNQYQPSIVYAEDQGSIDIYGKRTNGSAQAHLFTNAAAASMSANLQLRRNVYVCNTYQFDLDQRYCLLEPMDIVTITDANLGLNRQWVRITEIGENDDGTLSVSAEEVLYGTNSAPAYSFSTGQGFATNYNEVAPNVSAPIIFEPTDELGGGLEVWGAINGVGNWGGAFIWVSYDGSNYSLIEQVTGGARMGVTTSDLPVVPVAANGLTIDTTHTLGINLSASEGSLLSGTQIDAQAMNTACYIGPQYGGGEIIGYETATLTSTYNYNLTYLVRGGYGTEAEIVDHPAGSYFARLDSGIFKIPFDKSRIGSIIYIKFQSFNQYGGGVQTLSDVPPYSYTITGSALASPLPDVTNLYSNYESGYQKIYWDEIEDFRSGILYEIRMGSAWDSAIPIRTQAHPPFIAQGNGTFWVKAVCQPAAGLVVYSENASDLVIAGNQLSLNLLKSYDEQATGWTGTFTNGIGVDTGLNALRTGSTGNILSASPFLESLTTNAATASGNVLHFASVPAGITVGLAVNDQTHSSVIPAGTTVQATTSTTVTLTNNVTGGGVLNGDTIVFSIPDVIGYGGSLITNTPVYYTIPSGHIINAGSVINAAVNATIAISGIPASDNVLSDPNVLADVDFLQSSSTQFVSGWVEINVSQDGVTWGGWQKFVPGVYPGMAWNLRVALETADPTVIAYCTTFNFQVQLPPRIDHYQGKSIAAGGTTITFQKDGTSTAAAFNGGPGAASTPYVSVSWQATTGDTYTITGLSLSQMTIQFFNGGVGVARTANIDVEGY